MPTIVRRMSATLRTSVWYDPAMDRTPLGDEICELSAHIHGATADLTRMLAAFDDSEEWGGVGMRSCAHWLSIHAGFDLWTARELLRVGHALRELPSIAAAFAAGRLAFDKVRAISAVATAEDERIWLDVALAASGSQLAGICLAFRSATVSDDLARARAHRERRRLSTWWRDDGMLQIFAALPPEEGRVVLNAIESATAPAPVSDPPKRVVDPADAWVARRADALVSVCETWLQEAAAGRVRPQRTPRQLVVHVDLDTLTGADGTGRCHIEDGPALSAAVARRIGCDAEVIAVAERDGVPVFVGRKRRLVSAKMRRAMQIRDGLCRFPGCSVPAEQADGHHIKPWADVKLTELNNVISMCGFHHQRHHEGQFRIAGDANTLRFEAPDGKPIGPRTDRSLDPETGGAQWLRRLSVVAGRNIDANTALAGDAGERCDFDYAVSVIMDGSAFARTRNAEARAGP